MQQPAPTLDRRKADELVKRLKQLAQGTPDAPGFVQEEWTAADDAGIVLMRLFARMMELVLERLNRVPEKNLLAFLDLMGVGLLPPGPARAPVTFTLASTAGASSALPAGTQVATVQSESAPAVVFETEKNLVVTTTRLVAGYSVNPQTDRYSNRTPTLTGQEKTVFAPFAGDRLIEHILYVGDDPLLLLQQAGQLVLSFQLTAAVEHTELQALLDAVAWEAFKADGWQSILPHPAFTPLTLPQVNAFTLTFAAFAGADVTELSGPGLAAPLSSHWIRGQLTKPIGQFPVADALKVEALTATVEQLTATGIPPDQVHVNTTPVDFTKDFYPLGETPKAGDTFSVASTEALAKVEATLLPEERGRVELTMNINVADETLRLTWEYFASVAEGSWQALTVQDDTAQLTRDGSIGFIFPHNTAEVRFEGHIFRFFRVSITAGGYWRVPCLRAFQVTMIDQTGAVVPHSVRAFTSETPTADLNLTKLTLLDVTTDFFPFGLSPTVGTTFYFGFVPAFLDFTQEQPVVLIPVLTPQTAQLVWEYFGRQGWTRLGTSAVQQQISPTPQPPFDFVDNTSAFTQAQSVSFRRPPDVLLGQVNGQTNYWIRARLTSGYYGRPLEFVPVDPADPSKGFKPRPGTGAVNAPVISRIAFNYTAESRALTVVTQNQFIYQNQTSKNARGNTLFYKPFEPVEERKPTFYVGFNAPFENQPIDLYVSVPPRQVVEELGDDPPAASAALGPQVVWEYWNGRDWMELFVIDETRAFTESGVVQFLGPTDFTGLTKFVATPLYWIRARQKQATLAPFSLLRGLFLNTVQTVQATTVINELVGSSTGRPHQTFRLTRSPIQPGQRLLVREPEPPSADDEAQLLQEEGPDAIQTKTGPSGVAQYWVRWHETKSLRLSGPRSRHYTLERATGEMRFGDGGRGMIPPQGTDNVVCEAYQAGGGAQGNQPAAAIRQLKSAFPAIASVTNPEAADGGSDRETSEAVQARGPQVLKHRERAVAAEDFEWLARQATGTRVARAKCLPNRNRQLRFEPGWTTVILVPQGREKQLLPSAELVRQVEDFFAERAPAALTAIIPSRINVMGPGYVPVELEAEIRPVFFDQADVVRRRVLERLDQFLHPLTGGLPGEGWEFGRDVFLSELFAALEGLQGVEHVHSLRFKSTVAVMPLVFKPAGAAPAQEIPAGSAVTVNLPDGTTFAARLAEPLLAREPVRQAMVIVFREGECVRLIPRQQDQLKEDEAIQPTIRAISGNTLMVDPFRAQVAFPVGSQVESADGLARSVLKTAVPPGTLTSVLTIQGFETNQTVTINGLSGALSLATRDGAPPRLQLGDRLRVGEHYLAYSGTHTMAIVPQ